MSPSDKRFWRFLKNFLVAGSGGARISVVGGQYEETEETSHGTQISPVKNCAD